MINPKLFIQLCFLFFISLSCKKNIDEPSISFKGKVVLQDGNGLKNVKIFFSDEEYVLTDSEGNWQTSSIKAPVKLVPSKLNYSFLPDTQFGNAHNNYIIFEATRSATSEELKVLNWIKSIQLENGLLESSENSNVVSLYDNALAAIVFLISGDITQAESIFDFFNDRIDSEFKNGVGGFYQFRDRNGLPNGRRWLGDNAWLLIALNNHKSLTGSDSYEDLIEAMEIWIRNLQDTDGGVWGGFKEDNTRIHKVTEGQIDAFNAVNGYTVFHENILKYLEDHRWDQNEKNLVAWPGNEKYLHALDVHSWSYCAFENYPISTLFMANRFLTQHTATSVDTLVKGYCFDEDKDVVWMEGNGQMAVAFNESGNLFQADVMILELNKLILPSSVFLGTGGIPYSSNMGTSYGNDPLWPGANTRPCISSSAWYLYACHDFNPLAIGRDKNVPINDRFWLE